MELLTNRINKVYLEGEPDWSVTASWTLNGVDKGTLPVGPNVDGLFEAILPYIMDEGLVVVSWNMTIPQSGTYNLMKKYDVVTPLLSLREVSKIFVEGTPEEHAEVESAVRHIINAHTGQTFGKFIGTKYAFGNGDSTLALPARLMSLTGITLSSPGLALIGNFQSVGDGWYLKPVNFGAEGNNIKSDVTDYVIGVNGVIYDPYGRQAGVFTKNTQYAVEGVWGYEEVPGAVREAAKLLINDYASVDSVYRDRYLESLTSPDWRIQFQSGAFRQTGNVRADQLLASYVLKRGWAVI